MFTRSTGRLRGTRSASTGFLTLNEQIARLNAEIEPDDAVGVSMAKGDHLQVDAGLYSHHGIDMGSGLVAHYGRGVKNKANAKVEVVRRDVFSRGCPVHTLGSPRNFPVEEIVARARSRVGEQCYDVFDNNCEAFANWCRSGVAESRQATVAEACAARIASIGSKFCCRPAYRHLARCAVAGSASAALSRRIIPALIVADAVHGSVELVALGRGESRQAARRLAQTGGLATAAGMGWASAGPVGAAVGLAGWLTGDWVGRSAVDALKRAARVACRNDSLGSSTR